ncbi:MAG: recombinase family protein [Sphaerochaeta sp.]|nr:recombinase family protein [Sphaerochaeta sp.]
MALYCRVSTQMERQLNSLSAQMDFEKEDIPENPDWEYVGTSTDIKSGRTISSRPGFQSLLTDCEAGKFFHRVSEGAVHYYLFDRNS